MKKILIGLVFFCFLFWELLLKGYVAAPVDTLVGAYHPWLAYKWGYAVGVPVKNAMLSDVFSQFFIWKHVATTMFFSAHIPTWNPYALMGTPFLATFHSAVLFPGNIFFILPKFWGWNFFVIGSAIAAWFAMYFFLRQIIKHYPSAIIGATCFALGGPMTTWSELGTAVWAMALIPLILLCIERRKYLYIAPLFAGLILAGNVQACTYAAIIIPIYALVTKRISTAIVTALLLGVGMLLSSIQLLPTASFYPESIRAEEKYTQQFNYGLSPALQLIRFISPDIYGHPSTGNYFNEFSYHEYTGYFGTTGLLLAFTSIVSLLIQKKADRRDLFFIAIFFISIFLTIDTSISRFIFSQPIPLLTYSSASRLYFLTVLSGSYLAARGLFKLNRYTICISIVLFGSLLLHLITLHNSIALKNSLLPLAALILVSVAVVLPKKLRYLLLIVLVLFEMGRFYRKYNPFVPSRLAFPKTQATTFLQNHSGYAFVSLSDNVLPANTWMYYGIRSFEGYDPLHLQSFNRFAQVANSQKSENTPSRYVDIVTPNIPLLRIANVGYYVIRKDQVQDYGVRNFTKVFDAEKIEIYFDPQAKPFKYQRGQMGIIAQNYDPGWKARIGTSQLKTMPANGALLGIELPANTSINSVQTTYAPDSLLVGAILSSIALLGYLVLCRLKTRYNW